MRPEEVKRVGVIGLGLLGTPVAHHLAAAGHEVFGFDIDQQRVAVATELGVTPVSSVADVAAETEIMISALPSVQALDAVCDELGGNGRSTYLVELSTLPVDAKVDAAARIAQRDVTMLDCPVLGTSAQAEAGELVVCTSGPEAGVRAVDPVLETFTLRREYLGEFGAGTKMKLVANLLVAVHNAAAAEALTLAKQSGVDPATALRVLTGSAAGSRQLELRGGMMVSETYEPPTATISIFLKDVALISELARSAACPVPMHAAASNLFTAALAMGNADLDVSSVHTVFAALAGRGTPEDREVGNK